MEVKNGMPRNAYISLAKLMSGISEEQKSELLQLCKERDSFDEQIRKAMQSVQEAKDKIASGTSPKL